MRKITLNKNRFKALCLAFLIIGSCYNGSASAGIIIDSITANFSSGAFFKLEFDDTEYGPLPFGPDDINLNGVTGIVPGFPAQGAGDINVTMNDFQNGYIGAYINELGEVTITSFFLTFANGNLNSTFDYFLDITPQDMYLDYCPFLPTGDCNKKSMLWTSLTGGPLGTSYSIVSREAPPSDVPEPMTLSILFLGLLGIFASRKIRQPADAKAILA
ncbi:PEP-CTERM sorting domain-containing protein [Aestuariicella hydrocarbonica]|uniref:PEP-CTERM sorting domain-containing protein n=1 Tax=Pseudomaricurvus hydrocarbonicus TaxID=1470433 RepID=A0A9E5MMX5_9GAMM|nr:PEP-CTERM sorting domain-containing protein [Aestuariicella hydrocarbonica]NHO67178.1 PEP-CTERM sorting domain-containing protein [Aestuariicella hydrocarbonica]